MCPSDTNDEFMGMADYASESVYDLLGMGSESLSASHSSNGSHHPSHKCFMAEIHDGHVLSTSDIEDDPREVPAYVPADGTVVPCPSAPAASALPLQGRLWLEQL